MYKNAFLLFPLVVILCALCSTTGLTAVDQYPQKKPVIYLTFDDGPSSDKVTDRILEVLADYDARATFFVTGLRAKANPEKIAKIVASGHALGNHALSHSNLTVLADHQIIEEFSTTNDYVYAAGGPTLNCFRAPFGETDARVNGIASRMGMRTVGWTIDTRDWDAYNDPEHLTVQLEDSYHESIVLMHDGPSSRWRTLTAFSQWMQDVGDLYDFKALPTCVEPAGNTLVSLDTPTQVLVDAQVEVQVEAQVKVPTKASVKTIAQLLKKLHTYEFILDPDVIAQNESQLTATY